MANEVLVNHVVVSPLSTVPNGAIISFKEKIEVVGYTRMCSVFLIGNYLLLLKVILQFYEMANRQALIWRFSVGIN